MTVFIGIDPDTHHAGIAVLADWRREPLFLASAAIDEKKYKGEEATARIGLALKGVAARLHLASTPWAVKFALDEKVLIVESQKDRTYGKARKKDIIMLAQSAGVAVGVFQAIIQNIVTTTIVQPMDWKGNIDKDLHQSYTILPHYSWRTNQEMSHYSLGLGIKKTHEKHVIDAIGLAAWGMVRDLLPRDPNRAEEARLIGLPLTRQRLSRLETRPEQSGQPHR